MIAFIIFMCVLYGSIDLVVKNSDDYEVAVNFVTQDARVAATIGEIRKIRFNFFGFETVGGPGGHANYSFYVATTSGEFVINVKLRFTAGWWRVKEVDIVSENGKQTQIVVD